jgi:hypothetical protein
VGQSIGLATVRAGGVAWEEGDFAVLGVSQSALSNTRASLGSKRNGSKIAAGAVQNERFLNIIVGIISQ